MRIFGLILAGGGARRMGGADKALLRLGDAPLVTLCAERLGPQVEQLAISANGDAGRFGFTGLPVLADAPAAAAQGPLAGVLAGLDWAAGLGATALATVAVDTPHFPCDLVARLCLAAESAPSGLALAETADRAHPTCALWPVGLRDDLRGWLAGGEGRMMGFAARHQPVLARFPDAAAFMNINTPADLAAAGQAG
ncbi:molybdenum cofactor guanylyltransferase [Fertoebacter nigrum]|uniref:Molybdenum cofactor guanylyltransferase n=1 Tax=Fertoeibacter niger TaxID=2656921 RepID=A0A8X8H7G2_9RHOB|nr:molybdenum cofactor guanylyltransferase MobA [Fertoeibacter niger]NUB44746.1 molybdenum cofactor guanylyltransferase [Fertoeibacter niger]